MKIIDQNGNEYDLESRWALTATIDTIDEDFPFLITIRNNNDKHGKIVEWCIDNIGSEKNEWICYFSDFPPEFAEFSNWHFNTKERATAFKLMWI